MNVQILKQPQELAPIAISTAAIAASAPVFFLRS
jgi:hypothetical protein